MTLMRQHVQVGLLDADDSIAVNDMIYVLERFLTLLYTIDDLGYVSTSQNIL